MDVRDCMDASAWDALLTSVSYPPFTQLSTWGEVQRALGKRVRRLSWGKGGQCILAQWVEERRGPFTYWFCPQGPVYTEGVSAADLELFFEHSRAQLATFGTCFLRVEPRRRTMKMEVLPAPPSTSIVGTRVRSLNPTTSLLVPLNGSPTELFERCHKKTRYNIRLAERHAVIVRGGRMEDLPTFLRLLRETSDRDAFIGHDEQYLETVMRTLHASGYGRLRVAECLGKPLAMNFEVLCGDTVMYLYGASSSEDREKMAPYALQWSAMFSALQDGYRWYDFGGGNSETEDAFDDRPSWEGITRFKERWGAIRHTDAGTFDRPIRSWLYKLLVRR